MTILLKRLFLFLIIHLCAKAFRCAFGLDFAFERHVTEDVEVTGKAFG